MKFSSAQKEKITSNAEIMIVKILTICPNAWAWADGYIIAVCPLAACCGVTASGTLTAGAMFTVTMKTKMV